MSSRCGGPCLSTFSVIFHCTPTCHLVNRFKQLLPAKSSGPSLPGDCLPIQALSRRKCGLAVHCQVIMKVAPQPLREQLYSCALQGCLLELVQHPVANFVVQAYLAAITTTPQVSSLPVPPIGKQESGSDGVHWLADFWIADFMHLN